MSSQFVNIIGLTVDITGVILLFIYGLPADINKDGANYMEFQDSSEDEKEKWKKYNLLSRIGLSLIILGFIFQIAGNVMTM